MKRIIFICLLLSCAGMMFAQDKLFEKYADKDDVTSVYISKKMFQMFPSIESGGLNLMNLKGKVDLLQILTSEKQEVRENMRKDFSGSVGRSYEELMRVKDKGTRSTFYVNQKGELIREMLMLADTDSNYVVIRLLGNFTLQDIQQIADQVSSGKNSSEKP